MADPTVYRIHPAVGIARLGDSPEGFCISPEKPAQLPIECDANGNAAKGDAPIKHFKDDKGRIKRQAARFQIFAYDEANPQGVPLKIGDHVEGGGNRGKLVDIQWRVQLANKKAAWFTFDGLRGEAGYPAGTPLRNAGITDPVERQKLIIDAGPQAVDCTARRKASFGRDSNPAYAVTFPPTGMAPHDIDTLGDMMTDDSGRLLVLGGHGNSGSFLGGFGHPRIETYANSDGWFDDISDGPVMARLVMMEERVQALRYIDVEYPAWVLVGYPRYAPEVLDMITLEDVVEDMSIREFAYRTDMYGTAGTFNAPQKIDPTDTAALLHWKAGPVEWNAAYRPWFWRDIWPIIFRADEFSYFANILQQSNFPHNQTSRGTFDPYR
ncbi:LodA/GoxA family CTQ-dependent oxidase, partial [Mesorhizobium sp.]